MRDKDAIQRTVGRVRGSERAEAQDWLAVEEPLEIRLGFYEGRERRQQSISVTMRTPGPDVELALGFLFAEGIIEDFGQVDRIEHTGPTGDKRENRNVVIVELKRGVTFDAARLERHFYTTSSCGVCGKTSLEALEMAACPVLPDGPTLPPALIHTLPERLRQTQAVFDQTGGLHAAALFDAAGTLLAVREDVGRHNAMDKLVGHFLMEGALPLHDRIVLVSGRASFELTQKALMAGLPVMAAVGAPSSLAVELAAEFGMTLLGFVRGERYNIYCGGARIAQTADRFGTADHGQRTTVSQEQSIS